MTAPTPHSPSSSSLPTPAADALAASQLLSAYIAAQIEVAGGWISFERYMDLALYAPGLGYYAGGATKLGAAGDFITAPEMTPLFAQALSTQVTQILQASAPQILEFGAGSGALARDLLTALQAQHQTVQRYCIVEPSPSLRERQRITLTDHADVIEWLDVPPEKFRGAMLANEVLDAMPVQLFVRTDTAVLERGVVVQDGGFGWNAQPAPPALHAAVNALEAELGPLPTPYLSEWSQAACAWINSLAQMLEHGAALLIDYGFTRREFYHPQRQRGTLMCHYRHRAHTDPLWLPGLNDITAHVDFTAMAEHAQAAGLDVLGYTAQSHFLLNCGVLNQLAAQDVDARSKQAVQRLISEAEMGELFKVLAVGRDVDVPLLGFANGDRTHRL